jgi:hypothetical protein
MGKSLLGTLAGADRVPGGRVARGPARIVQSRWSMAETNASSGSTGPGEDASRELPTEEARLRAHLHRLVRDNPLAAVAAAAAVGGLLGGLAFARAGRLAFAVGAGVVAHDLWHREGRTAVDEILARIAGESRSRQPSRG